jgi:hypothetical protein
MMMPAPVMAMAVPVALVMAALGADRVVPDRLRRGAPGVHHRVRTARGVRRGRRGDGQQSDGRGNESKMSHLSLLTRCLPSQKT